MGGDFNEVLFEIDKRGGLPCDPNNLSAFRACLDVNGLRDVDLMGYPFTWSNKRIDGLIEEKLDRFVATEEWCNLFPMASAENITWDGSDHSPIIIFPKGKQEEWRHRGREEGNLFRFEARWVHHE